MQSHAYSSPALKAAGAIIDMTAAAHIDRDSPEPGDTMDRSPMFRSPEPLGTKMTIVNLRGLKPAGRIGHNSPEPSGTSGLVFFRSPEPGNTNV